MRLRILFFFAILLFSSSVFAQEKSIPVIIDGDEVVYNKAEEVITAKGNVVMKQEDTILECDEAIYDVNKGMVYVKGNFKIKKGVVEQASGTEGVYDFNSHTGEVKNIRMESFPSFSEALEGEKISDNEYLLRHGYITTCDLKDPHYRVVSNRIKIYPGDRVVARNVRFVVGKIPVFYTPYYSHSLKDKHSPVEVIPGKNKEWGQYVLTNWRYYFNDNRRGWVHADWYEKRGWGYGFTHNDNSTSLGDFLIDGYLLEDKMYELDKRNSLFDLYHDQRRNLSSPKYLEDDRYKLKLAYQGYPLNGVNIAGVSLSPLSVSGEFSKLSDEFFMQDYFYDRYEAGQAEDSYLVADYPFSNSSLSMLMRKRTNRFVTQVEYLPKLEYNYYTQSIEDLPIYFNSEAFLSNTTKQFSRVDNDEYANRFHSHNVLSYQKRFFWINAMPYVGMYSTYHSRNPAGSKDIWRQAAETGVTLNTNFYKFFKDEFNLFGDRIVKSRHVITPKVEYEYIHTPTKASGEFFQFDTYDKLQRKAVTTFTLENSLQVKTLDSAWTYVYLAPSVDYIHNEEGKGSYFNVIKTDLDIFPKPWVSLETESQYSVLIRRINTFNAEMNLTDTSSEGRYGIKLGHRYSRASSTQGTLELDLKITPKLFLENYLRYEYNTGDFQEQAYRLKVDLHCWWMDLELLIDDESDWAFQVMFTLKAYPRKGRVRYAHTYKRVYDRF
ncbi:MAG: hypothetical protein ABH858_04260 [Candidatus Omnitrophota bacterium]